MTFPKYTLLTLEEHNSRVPNQNGICQARDIVEICHSGLEPSLLYDICKIHFANERE